MTSLPVLLLALLGSPLSHAAPDGDPSARPRPARSSQDGDRKSSKRKPKSDKKPKADKPRSNPPPSNADKPKPKPGNGPAEGPRPQGDRPGPEGGNPPARGDNPPPRNEGERGPGPGGDKPQPQGPGAGDRPPTGPQSGPAAGPSAGPNQPGRGTPERGGARDNRPPPTDHPVGRDMPAAGEDARMPRSQDRAETQRRAERAVRPPASASRGTTNARRPYDGASRSRQRPPHRTRSDHRYHRPNPRYVRRHPRAHRPPPRYSHYRPWYTRWYVHPYYRYRYTTRAVVWLNFSVNPWVVTWAPPARSGWTWVPGYWRGPVWVPGSWRPVRYVAPRPGYVWVPGWWMGSVYVDGYWRIQDRPASTSSTGEVTNQWEWVEGYYLEDGTFVQGHWRPTGDPPQAGYTWEPGFWDGDQYVDGFWRPEMRSSYTWVSAFYDEEGVYQSGYWLPVDEQDGFVWVPGWFDGTEWIQGHWVRQAEYDSVDLEEWQPAEGYDDGWEVEGWGDGQVESYSTADAGEGDEAPLGIPVYFDEE